MTMVSFIHDSLNNFSNHHLLFLIFICKCLFYSCQDMLLKNETIKVIASSMRSRSRLFPLTNFLKGSDDTTSCHGQKNGAGVSSFTQTDYRFEPFVSLFFVHDIIVMPKTSNMISLLG